MAFLKIVTQNTFANLLKNNLTDNEPDEHFDVDPEYLPSATVLHMHTGKNKACQLYKIW